MYQERAACRGRAPPRLKRRGWGALRIASRSTTSGWYIAVAQATAPPQSWPATHARASPRSAISSRTSRASAVERVRGAPRGLEERL